MNSTVPLEVRRCADYLTKTRDEHPFDSWLASRKGNLALFLAEGFEERSLGILRRLVQSQADIKHVVLGRYTQDIDLNNKYRGDFESLIAKLSPKSFHIIQNNNDGLWVREGLKRLEATEIALDITGLSNTGIFGALDSLCAHTPPKYVTYTEAVEYWPKRDEWAELERHYSRSPSHNKSLGEILDEKPWLYTSQHHVKLVEGHEGYDVAGEGRALLAFLPFKCARLAAVVYEQDYASYKFLIGRPRLDENHWRFNALRMINSLVTQDWPLVEISTFGYRKTIEKLVELLLTKEAMLNTSNVHLAVLGSKLQTVGCWALSCLLPSITVIASIPASYFPGAFSEGTGGSWAFELIRP